MKWSDLAVQAKAGIIGGAALVAAAGVGLGVTQPWNQQQSQVQNDPPPVQQNVDQSSDQNQEKQLSVRAGNEVVPCSLYQGTGWSVYLPDGWNAQTVGENNALFSSGSDVGFSVSFLPGSSFAGSFVNLSADGDQLVLQFFSGSGEGSPAVIGSAPKSQWNLYGKLFTALAKTLTAGETKPFGDVYIIPPEPDWQKADGMTVLFLDKDGAVIDQKMQDAVEDYMNSWPDSQKESFTGQYRLNDISWASSFCGITEDGYIDVFKADVQYRLKDGASAPGAVNGWARTGDTVFLALFHDGGFVSEYRPVVTGDNQDWDAFAALLR